MDDRIIISVTIMTPELNAQHKAIGTTRHITLPIGTTAEGIIQAVSRELKDAADFSDGIFRQYMLGEISPSGQSTDGTVE
jgi:hypothetical protein